MKNSANENPIVKKSEDFAIKIIELCRSLISDMREYTLTDQIKRSGTSIGANIAEAEFAFSKAEFYAKMSIALKGARETSYWLKLLWKTEYISDAQYKEYDNNCEELIRILVSILKNRNSTE